LRISTQIHVKSKLEAAAIETEIKTLCYLLYKIEII